MTEEQKKKEDAKKDASLWTPKIGQSAVAGGALAVLLPQYIENELLQSAVFAVAFKAFTDYLVGDFKNIDGLVKGVTDKPLYAIFPGVLFYASKYSPFTSTLSTGLTGALIGVFTYVGQEVLTKLDFT